MVDRRELLREQTDLTGIDFVYVHDAQTTIDVYWHVEPDAVSAPLVGTIDTDRISITASSSPTLPRVPVLSVAWPTVEGRRVMRLSTASPGDFVPYRLTIDDARIDDYFNDVPFSFQAGCPSRLDCAPAEPACPSNLPAAPPTDYTARDFWGLRRAMLDAATLLEPTWTDRSVADQLVMLSEVLASVGDELSYTQDRIRWEGSFDRATTRRSLRRHAQLVDHRMHDGLGASTWLIVTTPPALIGTVAAGTIVWAQSQSADRVTFTVGTSIDDDVEGIGYPVDHRRNALTPFVQDADAGCLPAGATRIDVNRHVAAAFPSIGDPPQMVVLREVPDDPGVPQRAWVLPVTSAHDRDDPLVPDPATGVVPAPVSTLRWAAEHAPPWDFDLAHTTVYGNVVPAVAGQPASTEFVIGPAGSTLLPEAVERRGPGGSTVFLHSLPDPDGAGLVWRPGAEHADPDTISGGGDARAARPELVVLERRDPDPPVRWPWRPYLVGPGASTSDDRHITLDDGSWGPAATYRRAGAEMVHHDWLSASGTTIRFGAAGFGSTPPDGTHFEARYRLGNGRVGNVPADTIRHHDGTAPEIAEITNPLAVVDGRDRESMSDARRVAPHEWRTVTYRAVRTEDYAEALTRLSWVQAAGAVTAWTGSWLSVIATADPADSLALRAQWRTAGRQQLDRFRQAGRDVLLGEPRYADLDLDIAVCVDSSSYRGEVVRRIRAALLGDPDRPAAPYFFDPDAFVFGTPLRRAALEAAVQRVPGVSAVEGGRYRRRGRFGWRPLPAVVTVAPDELVRVADDRSHPDYGTVRIVPRGGA